MKALIKHIKIELARSNSISMFLGKLPDNNKKTLDLFFKIDEIYLGFYSFENLN